ncbi:MAG: hypothetical protein M3R55_09390 [Acidobacteriota bacterium]|nr:hypothetical protein [Acidobacteriota bacterium]
MTQPFDNDEQAERELIARVTAALDVPEPSPLFWDHFPARVRAAVAAQETTAPAWWRRPVFALVSAGAVVVLAAGVYVIQPALGDARVPAAPVVSEPVAQAAPVEPIGDLADDPAWDVVASVAASAGFETVSAAGFGLQPGRSESVLGAMNEAERAELVALMRVELKGDESGES